MASLTKMMNFYTILELVQQYKIDAKNVRIRVSKEAGYMNGTTA